MRRFALDTTRHGYGRFLLCVLVLAVGFAGIPRLELHAHAEAAVGHQHMSGDLTSDLTPVGDDDGAPDTYHAHDVPGLSDGLTVVSSSTVTALSSAPPIPEPLRQITSWRTSPPHRPPIV
jgi:hypothetical protein